MRRALSDELTSLLAPAEGRIDFSIARPLVMMVAGVNGAGKTTSIGKLAKWLANQRKSVLLAAGDTFRAAAREQLAIWGARNDVEVIAQSGGDPAAVVFDAVSAAKARGVDVLIADTAGRLPTQQHLMEELKRIKRAQEKAMPGAPHQVILIIDGTNGQNALAQVQAFDDAVGLTGLIITKLDGTAKGGVLAAIVEARRGRPLPILFIGVGEADRRPAAVRCARFRRRTGGSLMLLAAVDLGSNSFRLEIGKVDGAHIARQGYWKETVRLAAGLDESNKLSKKSIEIAVETLARMNERLRGMKNEHVRAVGTQSLRQARNLDEFLLEAQHALGFPIEVISGREEARLVFEGCMHTLPPSTARRLVVDIGGASTEVIVGKKLCGGEAPSRSRSAASTRRCASSRTGGSIGRA